MTDRERALWDAAMKKAESVRQFPRPRAGLQGWEQDVFRRQQIARALLAAKAEVMREGAKLMASNKGRRSHGRAATWADVAVLTARAAEYERAAKGGSE